MQEIEPHETELVKNLVQKDWICMDIGANVGYYTLLMAKQCKMVYAFEPEPNNFETLRKNVVSNKLKNVDLLNEAVTDKTDSIFLYPCHLNVNGANGMHRIYPSKWCNPNAITVHATMLDDYKYPRINFIKMDIEGAEMGALNGMVELLIKDRPVMMMEFHPPSIEEYGAKPEDEYNFLMNLGYKITLIPDIPIYSYQQLDKLTRDESGGQNILCSR